LAVVEDDFPTFMDSLHILHSGHIGRNFAINFHLRSQPTAAVQFGETTAGLHFRSIWWQCHNFHVERMKHQLYFEKSESDDEAIFVIPLKASKIPHHSELAGKMLEIPKQTANQTKLERFVNLAQSQRSALIIPLEVLLELSHFSCDLIVAIDSLQHVPIASLILIKGSPLQPVFEYG
jgi:hypothetical protein